MPRLLVRRERHASFGFSLKLCPLAPRANPLTRKAGGSRRFPFCLTAQGTAMAMPLVA